MSLALLAPMLIDGARAVLDRVLPDPELRARAETEIRAMERDGTFADRAELASRLAQISVNQADANSSSNYRGGWRPFIGWTCGASLAWTYVLQPVVTFGVVWAGYPSPDVPALNTSELVALLLALLGIGSLRTVEKLKGRA